MAMSTTEAAIRENVIHPYGELRRRDVARSILQLSITPVERARMHELAVKNQDGTLTPEEESELDHIIARQHLGPTVLSNLAF